MPRISCHALAACGGAPSAGDASRSTDVADAAGPPDGSARDAARDDGSGVAPDVSSADSASDAVDGSDAATALGPVSDLFQVRVTAAGVTRAATVYVVRAGSSGAEWGGQQGKTFHFAMVPLSGSATIDVLKLGSHAATATLRPNRLGLGTVTTALAAAGSTAHFALAQTSAVSVEFDDDAALHDALVLFVAPPEAPTDVPDPARAFVVAEPMVTSLAVPAGQSTVYFPAGVHQIGVWNVPATVTDVYLAAGAWVRGYILADRTHTTGFRVHGRGVLTADVYPYHYADASGALVAHLLSVTGGSDHVVEGITLVESTNYSMAMLADRATLRYVNIHGFRYNNDAIDLSGTGGLITNCFVRVNDDELVISRPLTNLTVQNSVFWPLHGGAVLQLGWYAHAINGITLEHSDVLHAEWTLDQPDGGLISAINSTSVADEPDPVVQGIAVTDVAIDTPVNRFVDLRLVRPGGTTPPVHNRFQNFTFTDVHLDHQGTAAGPILLLDAVDATHGSFGFVFQDLTLNGTRVVNGASVLTGLMQLGGTAATPTFR